LNFSRWDLHSTTGADRSHGSVDAVDPAEKYPRRGVQVEVDNAQI
jgi:hypothetical protein